MEKPQSIIIFEEVVYNADEVYQYDKLFFIGCANSRKIVEKKCLDESLYFYAYQKDGEWIKSKASYCRAKLFLKEDYVLQNVPKMMNITETTDNAPTQKLYKYEEAPPILELEDHEKFKDENGKPIEIEVRGERNSRNCYFRVKDVSEGFDMPSLRKTLLTDEYIKDIDYKTFTTSCVISKDTCRTKIFMFLTYEGMVKLLYVSRNKKAKTFRDWATEKLFVAQMGAEEDKDAFAAELIGVSAKTIGDAFRCNVAKTPCVYLIYIGEADELLNDHDTYSPDHMLCKFGRTDDLQRRVSEHARDYKRAFKVNAELLLFSIVENQFLSTAEDNLKQYFGVNRVQYKNLKGESAKELVVFHKDELQKIQQHYGMIQTTYIGQHIGLLEEKNQLQKELIECKYNLKLKEKEMEMKDKEMEMMKERHNNMIEQNNNMIELLKEKHNVEILTLKVKYLEKCQER